MNASTASRPAERGETKVCPGKGPAVEVVEMGDDLKKEAKRDAGRRLRITGNLGVAVEPQGIANRLGVQVYRRVDLRDGGPATDETRDDVYAKEFAACLLMPEEVVKTLAELGMDDLEMAVWLVVSREAIQDRLHDLGLRTSI